MATRTLSSAAGSVTALIGESADALVKGVQTVTSVLDVAHAKAQSWSKQAIADSKVADAIIVEEAKRRGIRRYAELQADLADLKKDARLGVHFDESEEFINKLFL